MTFSSARLPVALWTAAAIFGFPWYATRFSPPAGAAAIPAREPPPAMAVVFTGTVTDGAAPVGGVSIHIAPWNATTITDGAGRYTVTVTRAGRGVEATVTATASGFGLESKRARVQGDTVRVDFRLRTHAVQLEELVAGVRAENSPYRLRDMAAMSVSMVAPEAPRLAGDPDFNTEAYAAIDENPFLAARDNPLSTFSIDVDRASYANVRRFIRDGRLPPRDAVRIEELINYFTYDDPAPDRGVPFSVTTQLAAAPWKPEHRLLRIALKATELVDVDRPASNFVFLIDVSGSMQPANKLPLLKQSFALLVNELRARDRVALVVYAGAAGVVLESTPGDRKEEILAAIERLEAGGSTAGGAGLQLAYDIAARNHIDGGNNRVVLATDGDFNIGPSSDGEMLRMIEEKRRQGTHLTLLGFGTGNIKDSKMELLADRGNGNYAYIDDIAEARKVLVEELGGTMFTVAKDVKLQVEFNPARVRAYRLIGYENRLLAAEDFNDDSRDAGELGAGHSVTALYEVVPVGARTDVDVRGRDSLRYQAPSSEAPATFDGELAFVKLRYKAPDGDASRLLERPVSARETSVNHDFTFSAAVAAYGMILRQSPHRGSATLESVLALAKDGLSVDRGGYRHGFVELVEATRRLTLVAAEGSGGVN
jgi:Ca-activated chloride channel family protein